MKKIILVLLLCLLPVISVKAEVKETKGTSLKLNCVYKYSSYTITVKYENNTFSSTSSWQKLQDENITVLLSLGNFKEKETYTCPNAISAKIGGTDKGNNKTATLYEYKSASSYMKLELLPSSSTVVVPSSVSNTKSCVFAANGAEIIIEYNYDSDSYDIVKSVLTNNRTLAPLDDAKVKNYFIAAKNKECGSFYMSCPSKKNSTCTLFSKLSDNSKPSDGVEVKSPSAVAGELTGSGMALNINDFTTITCDEMLAEMPKTMNYLNQAFKLIKIIAPILVLVFGSLDYAKVVFSDKEDSLKKANSAFFKRIIAAVIIFLLPFLLTFLINIIPGINTTLCGVGV